MDKIKNYAKNIKDEDGIIITEEELAKLETIKEEEGEQTRDLPGRESIKEREQQRQTKRNWIKTRRHNILR